MLRQKELRVLQDRVASVQGELSNTATSTFSLKNDVKAIAASLDLEELEEHAALLSTSYLKSLRSRADLQPKKDQVRRLEMFCDSSELESLLSNADTLTRQLADKEANFSRVELADEYENLRALFITGIKNSIRRFYRKQVEKCSREQAKLSNSPTRTSQYLELERKPALKIEKFKGNDFSNILVDSMLAFNASSVREPVFSSSLEKLSLAELVPLAQKILKETKQHEAFTELHDTFVSERQQFKAYFRCEFWKRSVKYLLEPTEQGVKFLSQVKPHETALIDCNRQVSNLETSAIKGIGAFGKVLQETVIPTINQCKESVASMRGGLLGVASDSAKESAKKISVIKAVQASASSENATFALKTSLLDIYIEELDLLFDEGRKIFSVPLLREKLREINQKTEAIGEENQLSLAVRKKLKAHLKESKELLADVEECFRGTEYKAAQLAHANIVQQFETIERRRRTAKDKVATFLSLKAEFDKKLLCEEKAEAAIAGFEAKYKAASDAFHLVKIANESLLRAKANVAELCVDDNASIDTLRLRVAEMAVFTNGERRAIVDRELKQMNQLVDEIAGAAPLPEKITGTHAYKVFAAKFAKLKEENQKYNANPQDNDAIAAEILANKTRLDDRLAEAEHKQAQIKQVLTFFKDLVGDKTLNCWYGQTSPFKRFKACWDGAKINGISVPRGVSNGRKILDTIDKNKNDQDIILDFVKALSARLPEKSVGRAKLTEIIYQVAKDKLLSVEEKLNPLTDTIVEEIKAQILANLKLAAVKEAAYKDLLPILNPAPPAVVHRAALALASASE